MTKQYFGKAGENFALAYLVSLGYQIVCQNWRFKNLEVDIIAFDGDVLVFVEVKTRKDAQTGTPDVTITAAKQERLIRAGEQYLMENELSNEIRFDVITVIGSQANNFRAEHIKGAFR